MIRWSVCLAFLVTILVGCSKSAPKVEVDPNEPSGPKLASVPPPAALTGKWRLVLKDGTSSRTSIYNFVGEGRLEVDSETTTPERTVKNLTKAAITKVEGDTITIVDLSHTSAEGVEDVIPPSRHRARTIQYRISGDELHWTRTDDPAGSKSLVMTRVR